MCYNYEIDDKQLGIRNETNKQYNFRIFAKNKIPCQHKN